MVENPIIEMSNSKHNIIKSINVLITNLNRLKVSSIPSAAIKANTVDKKNNTTIANISMTFMTIFYYVWIVANYKQDFI